MLLADVLENFWNTRLEHYKLDPAHFYTPPALVWQALLNTASEYCEHQAKRKERELCLDLFKFELLTDIDMLLVFEKQDIKHSAKANNRYMKEQYNP